jgi:hypothetical protein
VEVFLVLGPDGQLLDRRVIDLDDDVDVALDLLGADTEQERAGNGR